MSQWVAATKNSTNVTCLCSVCRLNIKEGDKMADHYVYEFDGSLDYIELAHENCAIADNAARRSTYWSIG